MTDKIEIVQQRPFFSFLFIFSLNLGTKVSGLCTHVYQTVIHAQLFG